MPDHHPLMSCPLCHVDAAAEAQRQILPLAGLGTVEIGFGYCTACGHIYQVHPVTDELLSRHYEAFSNYTCFDPAAARNLPPSNATRRLLSLAQAHGKNPGRAYEVGCATARHLEHFRRAGWEVSGCDPSPKACDQASEIYGIAVACGTEAELLPAQKDLDLIYFCHVLEHLRDPASALGRAHGALGRNGMVMLEVPCAIAPETLPVGWFTLEHLHYFSENKLLAMLGQAGFEALEIRVEFRSELYPVVAAIAVKREGKAHPAPSDPDWAKRFVSAFTARDDNLWRGVSKRLSDLSGAIFIWGAGVHTAQLLGRTGLCARTRIVGIVDRDSQKWGHSQAGYPIISPQTLLSGHGHEPIVISSYASERDIARSLRDCGVAETRIVQLYN